MSATLLGLALCLAADRPFAPLPVAVSSLGAAEAGGRVYVYGGHAGKTHTYSTDTVSGRFLRLDPADPSRWEELPGGPGLQGLALVAHNGALIRVGGMTPRNAAGEKADTVSVASVARFDPAAGKWEPLPDLPEPRSSHDAAVIGDTLYVAGGWKMNGRGKTPEWHSSALSLDLSKPGAAWQTVEQPFRRRALAAAAHGGKLYVIAGLTEDSEMELGVDVYDPAAKKWSAGPSVPGPMANGFTPAACVAGGRLYLSAADGKLVRLNEAGTGWEQVGTLKQPRWVHRMVPVGDVILAVGGASKAGNVALTEALEPACCAAGTAVAAKPAESGRQAFCPVMTAVPVGGEAREVEYQGVKVLLCCAACERKWHACPEAYLDPKLLPQLAGRKLPGRPTAQVYCPVYRDRVVAPTDPVVEYKGVKVHVFNKTAKRKFEETPEKYADPEVLPQLKGAAK